HAVAPHLQPPAGDARVGARGREPSVAPDRRPCLRQLERRDRGRGLLPAVARAAAEERAARRLGSSRMAVVSDALRRDVRLLGDLLGRVLVEQEGESLLEDVERVRALARAARAGEPHEELRRAVGELSLGRQTSVLRAFALYFQLANVAEQHHRVRRRREYRDEGRVPRESLEAAFAAIGDRVPQVSLGLVLTAHPTEATRRSVLAAHLRIAEL